MKKSKAHLPERTCAVCGRPFAWRRKWRDCWDAVRYCSERCRRNRGRRQARGRFENDRLLPRNSIG
ncbi:MAG: DUF2256 domain-containing protein [Wenzhouxiangellaceae bacterium]|nr:DUF2256 domain-containing protein [Wenzhouxiangellaceae bacterium]